MKNLYKYPQREYPYRDLLETNRAAHGKRSEYESLDTGVFAEDRYFDVFVEYAKGEPEDLLINISVHNRGPEAAPISLAAFTLVPEYMVVGERCSKAFDTPGGQRDCSRF